MNVKLRRGYIYDTATT